MADELPNEAEALEDVRTDEDEARLDELEDDVDAYEDGEGDDDRDARRQD